MLVSTISNSQVILLKNVSSFCKFKKKLLTFCLQNIRVYAIFDDQSLNDTLTNDIVSFEQLGPGHLKIDSKLWAKYQTSVFISYLDIVLTRFSNCYTGKVERDITAIFTEIGQMLIKTCKH